MPPLKVYRVNPAWVLALPGCLFFGALSLFVTRYLLYVYYPEYYASRSISISRAAAFDPGSLSFAILISFTSFCNFFNWYFVFHHNKKIIKPLSNNRDLDTLNKLTMVFGVTAGVFLELLALIHSNMNGYLHELYSILFFSTQVMAFVFDSWFGKLLKHRMTQSKADLINRERRFKLVMLIFLFDIVLLVLYLLDKGDVFADETLLMQWFVFFEYLVSLLCFAWPATYYSEVKRHLKQAEPEPEPALA